MKKNFILSLSALLLLLTSCLKDQEETPVVQPQGSFKGVFTRLKVNRTTKKVDTTKVNLNLDLTSNKFTITGDTVLHAGSKGEFLFNQAAAQYADITVPAGANGTNLPKAHLNGIFRYAFDGTNLEFSAQNDTLLYYYAFKKQ